MKKLKAYKVSMTIHLSRNIKATSVREAEDIADYKGEAGASAYATEWKAKLTK